MNKQLENPFEYLRRRKEKDEKEGKKFDTEIVKNWYKARAFVLHKLGTFAFKADDGSHLHVIIIGDDPLMLSVLRQVALTCHYINYDEENEKEEQRKRTVITLVSPNKGNEIVNDLKKEEYLCNLLDYCKYTVFDTNPQNEDSYIDLELEIVNKPVFNPKDSNEVVLRKEDIDAFCNSQTENELYTIDTRKAQYASRMYDLGTLIENLPAENIHDAHRYTLALNAFQYNKLQEPLGLLINHSKWNDDQIKVKKGLSNIFCTDCFESRAKSIELCRKDKEQKDSALWAEYNEILCKSEHARWVVEKLIMGFRPLSKEERLVDDNLSPYTEKRKKYRNELKEDPYTLAHIDLCSYKNLRRINPDDMKYDGFLLLAIPKILEKINKNSFKK